MNSTPIILGLVLGCCLTAIVGQVDCSGKPDGAHGYGCRSYTNCTQGVGELVNCDWPNEAFDYMVGKCVNCCVAPFPCCEHFNCTSRGYKRFPVYPNCTYFYTCYQNKDLGASPCNNPPTNKLLVFDERNQYCNWVYNVPPPCGTKK